MKIENEKLIKENNKRYDWRLWALMLVGVLIIISAFFLDNNQECKRGFYYIMKIFCGWWGEDFVDMARVLRNALKLSLKDYCDLIITCNTMLMAAVIFIYSIMDSRRLGIPHRTIMSYAYGSYMVPILFVFTLVMMPIIYMVFWANLRLTTFACVIVLFVFQITIIFIILRSSSFNYYLKIIKKKEYEQYIELTTNKIDQDNVWLYWLRHFEQAVQSNELAADKMRIVRYILWVPFYQKKRWELKVADKCIPIGKLDELYQFYYKNMIAAFQVINNEQCKIERTGLYLVIYEFISNLSEWYKEISEGKSQEEKKTISCDYHMIISGIMNAVIDSKPEEGEDFCNYTINHCIHNSQAQKLQIDLYVLFQELAYAIDGTYRYVRSLDQIDQIMEWKPLDAADSLDFYIEFWRVWVNIYSLPEEVRMKRFINAFTAMKKNSTDSAPIVNIMLQKERMIRNYKNEGKNTAAQE